MSKMRIEFEPQDIEAIAQKMVEAMKPLLTVTKDTQESTILDIRGLAEYLKVNPSWIYKKTGEIPHFKNGKYLRFKKSAVDRWVDSQTVKPFGNTRMGFTGK